MARPITTSSLLIVTIFTIPLIATALSYQKGEKGLNGLRDENDLMEFQTNYLPKARSGVDDPEDSDEDNETVDDREVKGRGDTTQEEAESDKPKPDHVVVTKPTLEDDDYIVTTPIFEDETDLLGDDVTVNGTELDHVTVFALANTDVGRTWEGIPYRERYLWSSHDALCHSFDLSIPHGRGDHGTLKICLYRKEITPSRHQILTVGLLSDDEEESVPEDVYGFVKGFPRSDVDGFLHEGHFYGDIFMGEVQSPSRYFVEDVQSLAKLMEHSSKLLRALVMVLDSAKGQRANSEPKLNAIVTTGKSLQSFRSSKVKPSFLALSTGHNSFIISGTPQVSSDDKGRTVFSIGQEVMITIENDATVSLAIKPIDVEYKFRPNGQSILIEGLNVTNLEGQQGPVAVFAVSDQMDYGCVVPSPTFSNTRKGGFLCKICAGVDESFRKNFTFPHNDTDTDVYDFVTEMLDRVAWMFRSVDWNKDGKYDDIGITTDDFVFAGDYSTFGDILSVDDVETLYEKLAQSDFSKCCLGIMFTMKQFPGEVSAKSSTAKSLSSDSGICPVQRDPTGLWTNVILISANHKASAGNVMSPDQLTYLTAHEIGKAFGGSLDATGNPNCDTFQDSKGHQRHFILWPDVSRNVTVEEKTFSSCALKDIRQQLDSCRSSCFDLTNEPFCGNGIVEIGEECDCGSEFECQGRPCCYPRNGKYPCQSTGLECKDASGGAGDTAVVPKFVGVGVTMVSVMLTATLI